ncbi:MAG TPA: DUF3501 family protein [Rudaea sp.]|jgi:hypothetical protein
MKKLTPDDLLTLEAYAHERPAFRTRVLEHKRPRSVAIGANVTLVFEDRLTIQYQIQEMLRVERVFEAAGIQDELDAYNPLVPDGSNLKATMLIEFPDPEERVRRLQQLHGIEHRVALHIGETPAVNAIADEDMDRSNEDKTSAVHFLRIELDAGQVAAFKSGSRIEFVIDHADYRCATTIDSATRVALAADLD